MYRDDSITSTDCCVTCDTLNIPEGLTPSVTFKSSHSMISKRVKTRSTSRKEVIPARQSKSRKYNRIKPRRLLWISIRGIFHIGICNRVTKDSSCDVNKELSTRATNQCTSITIPSKSKNKIYKTPYIPNSPEENVTILTSSLSAASQRRTGFSMKSCLKQSRSKRKLSIVENIVVSQRNVVRHGLDSPMYSSENFRSADDFLSMVRRERLSDWLSTFRRLDPRYQILKFFNDVAREGANRIEEDDCNIIEEAYTSPILRAFSRASAFSVWRPTSNDAIRKMMTGEGTGKGLDVKGKSAKKGILSGFIPFLQIHEEAHKSKVRWPPKDGKIRIYYKTEAARNRAALVLTSVSSEMETTVFDASMSITRSSYKKENLCETSLENLLFDVTDPEVHLLDDYSPSWFGILVAERIFFNAYISKQDISRCSDYATGRPSEPAFQDMNFASTRKYKGIGPRAVVLQFSEKEDDALSPQSLVVAYEENNKITPVTSDFDCFLVGTRGVTYETPFSDEQVKLVKWLLTQIESILESPKTSKSWTSRWLEVLKECSNKGFHPEMPRFGFGDPKSNAITADVVGRLGGSGAVRHGAESFNYFFPQELDDNFLVISDDLEGAIPWKYVNVKELQDILCKRIDEGFTFPLNPKWILADSGWKVVYDKMMASNDESIQKSLAVWYPPGSGIRELIEDIHTRFPDGFQRLNVRNENRCSVKEGTEAMDLVQQQLERYIILQRAKLKLRCVMYFKKLLRRIRTRI